VKVTLPVQFFLKKKLHGVCLIPTWLNPEVFTEGHILLDLILQSEAQVIILWHDDRHKSTPGKHAPIRGREFAVGAETNRASFQG
jgi:hypothetical protein